MERVLFLFALFLSLSSTTLSARNVYCSIEQTKEGEIKINPNRDYLNDQYWDYILYNRSGEIRQFETTDDCINFLANFGWKVVRTDGNFIFMGKEIKSYTEIKSSRDEILELFSVEGE